MPGVGPLARRATALVGLILGLGLTGGAEAQGLPLASLTLASLDRSGAPAPPPGDRMSVVRPFGSWTLRCEVSLGQNRRLCAVEQVLERSGGAVLWRVARAADGSNVIVWSAPAAMDPAKGLRITLGPYSMIVANWTCRAACLALTPVTPPLEAMLLSAATVEMAYSTADGRTLALTGSMAGFKEAVGAAARDPFGKRAEPTPPARQAKR